VNVVEVRPVYATLWPATMIVPESENPLVDCTVSVPVGNVTPVSKYDCLIWRSERRKWMVLPVSALADSHAIPSSNAIVFN
jgi:hypothetical protein